MRHFVSFAVGAIGLLIFLSGLSLLIATLQDATPEEIHIAEDPVATFPLDQIEPQRSATVPVIIPKSAQWTQIRRDWGEPEFVISVVSSDQFRLAYCLSDLGMLINVYQDGKPISVQGSNSAHGYDAHCHESSLRFTAAPGAALQLKISRLGQRALPSGKLIVVGDWFYEKDKIVGDEIDATLRPFLAAAAILGLSLIGAATYFHRQPEN